MICLTGDVHHMSLRCNDQRFIPAGDTEVRIAARYVELLEKHGIKATLYICGKCFVEEWADLEKPLQSALVEVGGHMHRARQPRPLFDWYGRRTGNWNGPRLYQDWDIKTAIAACQAKTGKRPVAWRNHSYMFDPNTHPLLMKHGIKLISDEIKSQQLLPEQLPSGLVSHPLNVIPDHDHLFHAHRTPQFVEAASRRGYGADEFGAASYTAAEWGNLVLRQVEDIENRGGVATILAHPICAYLSDRFQTFEMLLRSFDKSKCVWARQLLEVNKSALQAL